MRGITVQDVGGVGVVVIATTNELDNVTISNQRRHLDYPLGKGREGGRDRGKRERGRDRASTCKKARGKRRGREREEGERQKGRGREREGEGRGRETES